MDDLTSPTVLSTGLLLFVALIYKAAMTPPTSRADKAIQVEDNTSKLIPQWIAIPLAQVVNYFVLMHFALEIYSLWAIQGTVARDDRLCPSLGPSTARSLHPNQKLPLASIAPLTLIILAGVARISCHQQLGRMFTWDTSILKDHKLITGGCYRFVRHPAYTAYTGLMVGYIWFLCTPGTYGRECLVGEGFPPSFTGKNPLGLAWALLYTVFTLDVDVYLIRRSFAEDGMLKREFGKEWEEWSRRVRWNVFPYIL